MKSDGETASNDSPPLLNLPDEALEIVWHHLNTRTSQKAASGNALLQTCSQLRKQLSQFIHHCTFPLRGLDGIQQTVKTHAQGWPRLAALKSIKFTVKRALKVRRRRAGSRHETDDEEDLEGSDDDDDDESEDPNSDDETELEDSDDEEFDFAALGRHLAAPLQLSAIERIVISSDLIVHHSDMYALAAYCPALRQLELGSLEQGGELNAAGDGHVLHPLSYMTNLTTLSLATPAIFYSDESITAFASSLQRLPRTLTDVRLKWSFDLSLANVEEVLHASRAIPGLKMLDVHWGLGSDGAGGQDYFSALADMQSLEDLRWRVQQGCAPLTICPKAVDALLRCTRLRQLCLDLTVEGMEAVRLISLPTLESLQVHMITFPVEQPVQREQALELTVSAEDLEPILQLPLHIIRRLRIDGRHAAAEHSSIHIASLEDAQRLLQLSSLLSLVPASDWREGEKAEESLHVLLPLDLQLPPSFLAAMVKVPGVQFHVWD